MKATFGEVEETFLPTHESTEHGLKTVGREIYKDPKTDSGLKKSAKGLLCVGEKEDGKLSLIDQVPWNVEEMGELEAVFEDGILLKEYSLIEVRETLNKQL